MNLGMNPLAFKVFPETVPLLRSYNKQMPNMTILIRRIVRQNNLIIHNRLKIMLCNFTPACIVLLKTSQFNP